MKTERKRQNADVDCQKLVLDAYFSCRTPNDDASMSGTYVEERKTTQEIQDELLPTMGIGKDEIVVYMAEHGYVLTAGEDGSPVWNIYRLR